VSVNEEKWFVVHVHVQLRLDELRGPFGCGSCCWVRYRIDRFWLCCGQLAGAMGGLLYMSLGERAVRPFQVLHSVTAVVLTKPKVHIHHVVHLSPDGWLGGDFNRPHT
jgi:hypothetical protein